jgi:hypothetical protein
VLEREFQRFVDRRAAAGVQLFDVLQGFGPRVVVQFDEAVVVEVRATVLKSTMLKRSPWRSVSRNT